jgi:hypothetical protein
MERGDLKEGCARARLGLDEVFIEASRLPPDMQRTSAAWCRRIENSSSRRTEFGLISPSPTATTTGEPLFAGNEVTARDVRQPARRRPPLVIDLECLTRVRAMRVNDIYETEWSTGASVSTIAASRAGRLQFDRTGFRTRR